MIENEETELDYVEVFGDEENGYSVAMEFDTLDEEENQEYQMNLRITNFDSPEEVMSFYSSLLSDKHVKAEAGTYGNTIEAELELSDMDTSAAYRMRTLSEDEVEGDDVMLKKDMETREWAVNVSNIVNRIRDEEPYNEAVDNISATTLAAVSLAESLEEPGETAQVSAGYDLFMDIMENLRYEEGPITLDIETEEREALSEDLNEEVLEPETVTEEEVRETEAVEEPEDTEEQNYEELLDQNVPEVKDRSQNMDEDELARLLELERQGEDRVTLKKYLEERIDESERE